MPQYTLFVDESGEPGITNIRTPKKGGASRYMTLGAVVIRNSDFEPIYDTIADIQKTFKKNELHCKHLNHYQKIFFARTIILHHLRFFGVISDKYTLLDYRTKIEEDHSQYYNKCVMYLLEKVGWFMETRGLSPTELDIVFEKTNIDYDKMRNLITVCKRNPLRPETKKLKFIDEKRISYTVKDDEPMLQVADLVAHSLFKCVDNQPSNYDLTEPRYLKELSPRFFGKPADNLILNAGIYCAYSTRSITLPEEIDEFLKTIKSQPPSKAT